MAASAPASWVDSRGAPAEPVFTDLLQQQFTRYPSRLLAGLLFAGLATWVLRDVLPAVLLWIWISTFVLLNGSRIAVILAFRRASPERQQLARWRWFTLAGSAGGGSLWGLLGGAVILAGPQFGQYALMIFFVLAIFATLQAASPASYPPAFYAYVGCAIIPMLAAAALQPEPYAAFIPFGMLFIIVIVVIGRQTHGLMVDSLLKRRENMLLLEDLLAQKEKLDQAIHAKAQFLAAASHDLRQPMQALLLLVEVLQERVAEPQTRQVVTDMRSSVGAMAALLNSILDISKFEAGAVKPERSHFRVAELFHRLQMTYAESAAEKGLELRIARTSAIGHTDAILLFRILANIAANALRYTERGRVLVGCRRRGKHLEIQVLDTGPGIPQEELGNIFKEFYQLQNPARDREQGLGLGLAIVERTAHLLEHPLAVRSSVGKGSNFSILIPCGEAREIGGVTHDPWTTLAGCTVLVVDDEPEIRAAMQTLLEGWGCQVVSAAHGDEVRNALETGRVVPDVVLADYRLPGAENGIQVVRNVQRLHPRASGILVTGDIAPEILREAERAGLKLLHKPLRPARLRALLGNVWRDRVSAP